MSNFFTSDLHLSHGNICRLANRPFSSVEEMNETLINNYNSRVTQNDTCYFTGDVVMGNRHQSLKLISQLNGHKILILGNHDYPFERNSWTNEYLDAGFESIHKILTLNGPEFAEVGGSIRLQHFPVLEAGIQDHIDSEVRFASLRLPCNGSLHLSGHTHLKEKIAAQNNIHIGVDAWDFYPVSYAQIVALYNDQGW